MMAENKPFEIPPQVRELAEKNIDQARKFYDQWMEGISQVMDMWSSTSAGEMVPGFDNLRERAIKFAKDNAEAAFAQAEKLAQAKDVQDLMTLQSHYAQAQMRSYATQAQELGRLMTTAMQNMQSPKP
jgi:phasin